MLAHLNNINVKLSSINIQLPIGKINNSVRIEVQFGRRIQIQFALLPHSHTNIPFGNYCKIYLLCTKFLVAFVVLNRSLAFESDLYFCNHFAVCYAPKKTCFGYNLNRILCCNRRIFICAFMNVSIYKVFNDPHTDPLNDYLSHFI